MGIVVWGMKKVLGGGEDGREEGGKDEFCN